MKIEFQMPDGRERQIMQALLELKFANLTALDGREGIAKMRDPMHMRATMETVRDWAQRLFPDITFALVD